MFRRSSDSDSGSEENESLLKKGEKQTQEYIPMKTGEEPSNEQTSKVQDEKSKKAINSSTFSKSFKIIRALFRRLFSTVTRTEKVVLVLGTVFAYINASTFLFLAILFGSMTDSFVLQSVEGYANSTVSAVTKNSQITTGGISGIMASIVDFINSVVLQTFAEHKAKTKDEFIDYVNLTGRLFIFLAVSAFLTTFFQVLCWEWVAVNQKFRFRETVFKKSLRQDMAWFTEHHIGEVMANIFSETNNIREALGYKFCKVVQSFIMIVLASLIAISINWRLAIVFLSTAPFIFLRILAISRTIGKSSEESKSTGLEAEEVSTISLNNVFSIAALCQEKKFINIFGSKVEESMNQILNTHWLISIGNGILSFLVLGSYAVAFWYSCQQLMQHSIVPAEINTIFLAMTMGTLAVAKIIEAVPIFGIASNSSKHLHRFGEPLPKIDSESEIGISLEHERVHGEIEFRNVDFDYSEDGEFLSLNQLSFKIEAGTTVVILGEDSSGKSTIANLLLRFYDPLAGEIEVDGHNLKDLQVKSYRRHIGIAFQETCLHHSDIDENIRAGREYLTLRDIELAKFVVDPNNTLPQSYKDIREFPRTILTKVNLARAICGNSAIVILDEPFSGLFPQEVELIRKRIEDFREGKTTIILTDNVSNLYLTDLIYILEDGKILPNNIGTLSVLSEEDESIYREIHKRSSAIKAIVDKTPSGLGIALDRNSKKIPESAGEPKPQKYLALYDINPIMKYYWTLGIFGCIAVGASAAIFAYFFVEIYEIFSESEDKLKQDGLFWSGMLFLLSIINAFGQWIRPLFMTFGAYCLILSIRTTSFASILRRPKEFYDQRKPKVTPGVLGISILCRIPRIRCILVHEIPELISTLVTIFCVTVIVCSLVGQIGLITIFIILPILFILSATEFVIQKRMHQEILQVDNLVSDLVAKIHETSEPLHAFSMQEYFLRNYAELAEEAISVSHQEALVFSLLVAVCEALLFIFFGVSFLYGSYLIKMDAIHPTALFKIFYAVAFCIISFSQTVSLMPDLARGVASLEEVNKLILEEDDFDPSLDPFNKKGRHISKLEREIEFKNVEFKYFSSGLVIFSKLNLKIPSGKTVAILGSGGTTLIDLMLKFYNVDDGELLVDGINIKHIEISHWRKSIGWVPEEISFFPGNLEDNILYGCEIEDCELSLKEVLGITHLNEDFCLEDVHDYYALAFWNKLSRRLKVLIAIARVLVRSPHILLINRPTNAMSLTEQKKVLIVLKEIKKNRTCVIISKLPNTLVLGDQVVVFENGRVVEEGPQKELLSKEDGYYKNWIKTFV